MYADLIKSLRGAPSTIPLALGNLREEIQYEQAYIRRKLKHGDEFAVFSEVSSRPRKQKHEFFRLMDQTLRHIWREFCDLERPFIIKGQTPWSLHSDELSGFSPDLDEKVSGSRRRRGSRQPPRRESFVKNRMGMIEAGLSNDRGTYYNTDLFHRFLWWWKADDMSTLAGQVQRLQIRRIERDVYEADELVKRVYRIQCGTHGWNSGRRDDSDESYSDRDDGSGSDDGGGPPRGTVIRRRNGSGTAKARKRGRRSKIRNSSGKAIREVYEREIVRPHRRSEPVASPRSENVGRNDRSRRGSVVYEYEVVNPGRIYVETSEVDRSRFRSRQRSYSRERD